MRMADALKGPGFAVGLAVGILIGLAILWCIMHPQSGGLVVRILARICAVVALGFGVNWLVTPLADLAAGHRDVQYESPLGQGTFGSAIGWGAGALVFGIAALVLSFIRTGTRPHKPSENSAPAEHKPEEFVSRP
jgi:hypothetical protein